jgi:hypothetical protein
MNTEVQKDILKKFDNILDGIRELSNVFIENQVETDKEEGIENENGWFILDRWKDLQNINDTILER